MDILLLGPPGAGKGTQGALLAERLGLPKFATGDLLRDAVKRATPVGLKAKAVMEAGHLVNDEIIMGVVRDELAKPEAGKGVIFDGVVRTVPQAEGSPPCSARRVARSISRCSSTCRTRRSSAGWPGGARWSTGPMTIPRRLPRGSRPTGPRRRRCWIGTGRTVPCTPFRRWGRCRKFRIESGRCWESERIED